MLGTIQPTEKNSNVIDLKLIRVISIRIRPDGRYVYIALCLMFSRNLNVFMLLNYHCFEILKDSYMYRSRNKSHDELLCLPCKYMSHHFWSIVCFRTTYRQGYNRISQALTAAINALPATHISLRRFMVLPRSYVSANSTANREGWTVHRYRAIILSTHANIFVIAYVFLYAFNFVVVDDVFLTRPGVNIAVNKIDI